MFMFYRSLFVLLSFFAWPLFCLFFFDIRPLITLWYLLVIVLSVLPRYTASDYPFGIFWSLFCLFFFDLRLLVTPLVSFGHCIFCSSLIYGFWLHLWYLQTFLTYVRKTSLMKNLSFNILDWLVCYFSIFLIRWYCLFMMTSASKRMSILNF
jgi:hypothetical protein